MRKYPGFGLLLLVGFSVVTCCAASAQRPMITALLVNGVASHRGHVADTLTIEGTGFGATIGFSTAVMSGGQLAGPGVKADSWSDTRIVAPIPQTAFSGQVVVTVNGKDSNAVNFVVIPVITGVFPPSAPAGKGVTIVGRGFGTIGGGTVTFNGLKAAVGGWTDSSIVATVPAGATAGPMVLTVAGVASNSFPFIPMTDSMFETLIVFNGAQGARPVNTPLVQGTDGNLYGTTLSGGANGSGTVFRVSPAGGAIILYSFCSLINCQDGSQPYGGLVLGRDGNFYGTTSQGGAGDGASGTIFKITPPGILTTLHSFAATDGARPNAPLIQAANGMFYGLTQKGGPSNSGTFFRITPGGSLTTLFNFSESTNFAGPLVEGSDGNFYGTSQIGGAGHGMVFKLTPNGGFSILHSFNSTDGSSPAGGLLAASDRNLYGTTYRGGSSTSCPSGCGTVFKITLAGALTTLHSFNSTDGANPIAGLIQATDGNLYGTTYAGGSGGNWGTLFKITRAGAVTTLHSFQGSDGAHPYGPVSEGTNGQLYGTATNGTGVAGRGTAFLFATGLRPFVRFVQNRGKVGTTVGILGLGGLNSTTSVLFGNTSATFKIRSDNYLTATVPAGATTAVVTVNIENQSLRSNEPFQVLP